MGKTRGRERGIQNGGRAKRIPWECNEAAHTLKLGDDDDDDDDIVAPFGLMSPGAAKETTTKTTRKRTKRRTRERCDVWGGKVIHKE